MVIKFVKLTMLNFKGVYGERTIEFNDTLTLILGANKTGKTTISDAVQWVLFGKNSEGKTAFGIKTRDLNGDVIPKLDHEVTLTINAGGNDITLKRCWAEVWGKPKNQDEEQLTGHKSLFFVNGNKYSEKEYQTFIESLITENMFKAITNPDYFTGLSADSQRALLTKMVGDVSLESIAQGNADFEKVLSDLNGITLEDYIKQLQYKIKEINEELKRIPIRISEQNSEISKLNQEQITEDKLKSDLKNIESAIERLTEEIEDKSKVINSDYEGKANLRSEINRLKTEVQKLEFEYNRDYTAEIRHKDELLSKAQNDKRVIERDIETSLQAIESAKRALSRIEIEKADFRQRWAKLDETEFKVNENEIVCPTCKRELEGNLEEKLAELRETFNKDKSAKIEKMIIEAGQIKETEAKQSAYLKEYENKIEQLKLQLPALDKKIDEVKAIVISEPKAIINRDERYITLIKEIELRNNMLSAPVNESLASETAIIDNNKKDLAILQKSRDEIKEQLFTKTIIKQKYERINQLEADERQLNIQKTELEGKEYRANELTIASITELENKINSLFVNVKFNMFEKRINGNLTPICECMVDGVPYSDLNKAGKINAGIDIINAISKHNDIYAPCIIDNAESINDILPMRGQAIHLIVSRDEQLTIINQN